MFWKKISDIQTLSGWGEKYKLALSKSDPSLDNSYCVELLIVSLTVNVGRLQLFICEDNFCCSFLLCDVIDLLRM